MRGRGRIAGLVIAALIAACTKTASNTTAPKDTTTTDRPPPPPARVASVLVTPGTAAVGAGGTIQLRAQPRDSAGTPLDRTVTWSTSDPAVARVSGSGSVTAVAPGIAFISAQSDGQSARAMVNVPIPPNSNAVQHVFVLVEENTEYMNVIGSASMPYLNALAGQYGLATQYYGDTHPSMGNYFMLTTGAIISNDDAFAGVVDTDNVVRRLVAAGRSWRSYAADLPATGYLGGNSGNYVKHHNPFVYLSDVVNDSVQRQNIVPFTQLAQDMASGHLPAYGFIVPNVCDDGHNCSLPTVDQWLQVNIAPLLRDPTFQKSGLLIITFDEGQTNLNGGGRVAWVAVGPRVRRGFTSATTFQHESTLRFALSAQGLSAFPNASAGAPSMAGFLTP